MSSLGTARSQPTTYRAASAPATRPGAGPRRAVTVATAIATVLTMIGVAAILAGLTGVVGIEPLGFVRTVFYLGLGLAGAGSGGLLLMVLGDLRRAYAGGDGAA